MRFLFLLSMISLPLVAENYRSAVLTTGDTLERTLSGNGPFGNMSELRIEFRLSSLGAPAALGGAGTLYFTMVSPTQLRVTNWFDGGESLFASFPAGINDVLIRVQRSVSSRKWSLQVWNADGSSRLSSTFGDTVVSKSINFAASEKLFLSGSGTHWAWFRLFDKTVSLDSSPPSNVAADSILNYEFEGNGNDSGGYQQHLQARGRPLYASTPVRPLLGEARTVRAGHKFALDCGNTDASDYAWEQVDGPSVLSFTPPNAAQTTVNGADKFGEYQVQCRATSRGSSLASTTVLKIGAVITTDDGVVIPPTRAHDMLLGPMLRANLTEWSWYDRTRRETGEYWAAQTKNYTAEMASIEGENYYDSALVQYQNYFRTGFTRHLVLARAIADKFYQQFFKQQELRGTCASNFAAPRDAALVGLIIRAMEQNDGPMMSCLTTYASFAFNLWVELRGVDKGSRTLYYGTREGGYSLIYATALAEAHPDAAVRAQLVQRVDRALSNYFRAHQCKKGDQRIECRSNYTTGQGSISVTKGSNTIVGSGTNFAAFFRVGQRIAFKNPAGTNYNLEIGRVESDARLTVIGGNDGDTFTSKPLEWAKDTQDGLRPGGYRSDDGGVHGWFDQVWHSALLIEGVARAYRQGIGQATAKVIIVEFGNYLLNEQRLYLRGNCGFSPNPPVRAHSYLTFSITGDWNSESDCKSPNDLKDMRASNNTMLLAYGQAFRLTGNSEFRKRGDEVFAATFGYDSGPGHDFHSGLAVTTYNNGKLYGQSFRSSGWYLVDRVGPELPKVNAVLHGASLLSGLAVAPGQIVRIVGQNIGPDEGLAPEVPSTVVGETRVLFDGVPAPLLYVRTDQISAVVPFSVDLLMSTSIEIELKDTKSVPVMVSVQPSTPGIFTVDGSGRGAAALANEDGTLNSQNNPAPKGSRITFLATGVGQTNPPGVDGKLGADSLPQPVLPVVVGIGDMGAEVIAALGVPSAVAGIIQIEARVPPDAPSGAAVPLVIKVGDSFSQAGVWLAIR